MQSQMNLKIKFRESFRPFAPSVLRERVSDYFEMDCDSPYMLLVAPVKKERQIPMTDDQRKLWGIEKLNVPRSDIPAITHIDYSARVQTVTRDTNPDYYDVIGAFEAKTHLSSLLDEVEGGQEIVITKHGRPVARLVPPHPAGESRSEELVAWLKAFRRGRRLGDLSLKDLIEEGRR